MTKITTDWNTGDLGPTVHTKVFALHDWWFGEDARAGEATIQPSITRLSSYLSGTAMFPLTCGPDGDTAAVFGPKLVLLNNPDLLMGAVTPAGGVTITATEAYTDPDATVKATPGQSVAALRNAGGGDIIATQAIEEMRPAYGEHPASGLRNQVPNNIGAGATVGVMGSGGALPDGMFTLNISGREIVAGSLDEGYIDLRLFGTPTGIVQIFFYGATVIRAATGQTWVASTGLGIVGGNLTNISSVRQIIIGRDASGTLIASGSSADIKASLSATVARFAYSRTLTEAGVGRTSHSLQLVNTGDPIDITLRIQLTQMEQGSTPSGIQRTSINGLNVVQPPFRQVSYLKPDGIDDFMTLSTAFEPEGAYTVAAAVSGPTDPIFGGVTTGTNSRHIITTTGGGQIVYRLDTVDNQLSADGAGFLSPHVHVIRVEDATTGAVWLNGTALTTTREGDLTPTRHSALFRFGSFYGSGRFYGGTLLPSAITEASRARLQRWLSYISGVDL